MFRFPVLIFVLVATTLGGVNTSGQDVSRRVLRDHVPGVVGRLPSRGRLSGTTNLSLAIGLPLRNRAELTNLLAELYNPASPNFHRYLTPEEFTARFGPTKEEYQAVRDFARSNGFAVTETYSNRLVLDVEAPAADVERAFRVTLRTYRHPTEQRDFYAPDIEPSVPTNLPVVDLWGLSNFGRPKPMAKPMDLLSIRPLGGSGPSGYYAGDDFRRAYVPGTSLTGAGQAVGLLQFSDYFRKDITNYQNTIGRTNYVTLTDVIVSRRRPTTANNVEVALDIETAIAMAPGLSKVIVYEINTVNPSSILSRMASDNQAKQLSSSWVWSGGPSASIDNIFQQMAAQGQSFFQASGDYDAYTGGQLLDDSSLTVSPVDSPYLTSVGGTTLTMSGSGVSWSSETVWNYHSFGGTSANTGSGGGISTYYAIPAWQTNVSMAANSGSTIWRNIPDVALTADGVYVAYDNGSSGGFAGTSCAAPLWAGLCALINQQSMAANGTTVGFLNPALYAIAAGSNYANCFHDVTTGDNVGTNTPGLFNATPGYDLCTGLGTPKGTALINALAPAAPVVLASPTNRTVTGGSNAAFSGAAGGASPLAYRWLFNGTNLPAGGNVSGTTSNVLSIVGATLNNAGSYQFVVTNSYGAATSSVAVLMVVFPPSIAGTLTNRTIECGSNLVSFSITASGTPPFSYQWRLDSAPVANATNASFSLTNLFQPDHTVGLTVTNLYGSVTSNAWLTVVDSLAPVITLNGDNPVFLELGGVFDDPGAVAVDSCAGTLAVTVIGAVNTSAPGTNLLTYVANDGSGNTNSVERLVIVTPDPTPAIIGVGPGANGSVDLTLQGALGFAYVLQSTTNLFAPDSWEPVATNVVDDTGLWHFSDPQAASIPQRFYRLMLLQ
jgi:subtilase family serine protease